MLKVTFLVVGGGIAGVSCVQTLALCCPEEKILLLTESNLVKTVINLQPVAKYVHKFDVQEKDALSSNFTSMVTTLVDHLEHIEVEQKICHTTKGQKIQYQYLCLCTGGRPRLIQAENPKVLGIRDTDSVLKLQKQLVNARSICLLGNGGIASELAYELKGVHVHWVIKDNYIASTFVDAGAAHFFLQQQQKDAQNVEEPTSTPVKRMRYEELQISCAENVHKAGAALGPDWHRNFQLQGSLQQTKPSIIVHYQSHIEQLLSKSDYLEVTLSDAQKLQVDFLVSATGVSPEHSYSTSLELETDAENAIKVNELMLTNLPYIYAAGDVCAANWPQAEHWFQMRLWTQARQMGCMAGRSMAAAFNKETIYQDFCFELFGHCTQLFGYPVVLLGRFNAQGLPTSECELLLRSTPGKEYIKFVLHQGRLRGAILIGNTELAETCENLILNGTDLTPFGDDILNPDIDIEDYFD